MDHEVWLVIKSMASFYEVIMTSLHQDEWHYSEHDCKVIEESLRVMATMYKKLAWRHMEADGPAWISRVGPRWKWVPKHHHVLHIEEQARLQCMHLGWGYMSEGFMGTMKKVGESCRHACKAANRSNTTCGKWAMGTTIILQHMLQYESCPPCVLEVHAEHVHEHGWEDLFGWGHEDP